MFKWLKRWLEQSPKPLISKRSRCPQDHLTDDEADFISMMGRCPDCELGTLYRGPEGGCSVNVACGNCGSEFNLIDGMPTNGERISPPGPRLLKDRAWCYGFGPDQRLTSSTPFTKPRREKS